MQYIRNIVTQDTTLLNFQNNAPMNKKKPSHGFVVLIAMRLLLHCL